MEREVLLEDLKKLYSSSDMVKADCGGCKGCHRLLLRDGRFDSIRSL